MMAVRWAGGDGIVWRERSSGIQGAISSQTLDCVDGLCHAAAAEPPRLRTSDDQPACSGSAGLPTPNRGFRPVKFHFIQGAGLDAEGPRFCTSMRPCGEIGLDLNRAFFADVKKPKKPKSFRVARKTPMESRVPMENFAELPVEVPLSYGSAGSEAVDGGTGRIQACV